MKKINLLLLLIAFAFSTSLSAQYAVTRFLGIPVDGSKNEMKSKLIAKGFSYDQTNDCLTGHFNGQKVNVYIHTNNGVVDRIAVMDANVLNEGDIRIRFNVLCKQFENNDKYIPTTMESGGYYISQDEDISYEMSIKNKRYEASFYQKPEEGFIDKKNLEEVVMNFLKNHFSEEQLANPTQEVIEAKEELCKQVTDSLTKDVLTHNIVWFTICEHYGDYYIALFYDNLHNQANGEDL